MALAILVLITALSISAVAIYYSVAGLVAIFAAAALPIMIMGGVLEVGKLVTAVWLHKYWKQAAWWLRTYLSVAVIVLMLITSMGIFGFLSKAHIEQTSAGEESVAQVERLTTEIARQESIIVRANEKIEQLESSGTGADANIQSQIDKEQERIDKAFDRIKPAIEQQNKIITDAREADGDRTKPYENQLASITAEILRLETSAREYEEKIANLDTDSSGVEPLLAQIAALEEEIIRVTNQLQSKEQGQVRAGQAIIGVTSDGLFGGNTRTALAKWVQGQRDRITQIQGEVAQVRKDAVTTVDAERDRLAQVVKDIRTVQIPALKERELTMLGKIDEVRQTESPVIQTARDEIQRLRESAEAQVANSQALIERLRSQLAQTDKADEIDAAVNEQSLRIKNANAEIDTLTQEKYALEADYRKLEAEVGPIKYIAEFVYGDTADKNMLEEAVRWVIIVIIFVFDPLAVLLLIASQYTFEFNRKRKDDDGERLRREYEQARAQRIVDNPGVTFDDPVPSDDTDEDSVSDQEEEQLDVTTNTTTADDDSGNILSKDDTTDTAESDTTVEQPQIQVDEQHPEQVVEKKELESSEESKDIDQWNNWVEAANKEAETEAFRAQLVEEQDHSDIWTEAKRKWKQANPNLNVKDWKQAFISGRIKELPWSPLVDGTIEDMKSKNEWPNTTQYVQNEEQSESSVWKKIQDNNNK